MSNPLNSWQWLTSATAGILAALIWFGDWNLPAANVDPSHLQASAAKALPANPAQITSPEASELVAIVREAAELRRRVADLTERVRSLEKENRTARPTTWNERQATRRLDQTEAHDRALGRYDDPSAHFENLQARLLNEPMDEVWGSSAMRTIVGALEMQQVVDVQVDGIDCRSSLCRVDLRTDPDAIIDELIMALPIESRRVFPRIAVRIDLEDPTRHVLYLGSEDDRL